MERPVEMLHRNDFEFSIWYDTYDPNFIDISKRSRIPDKWLNFQRVMAGDYKDSVIKPINRYVEVLYPAPELISINNNEVRLRQRNHAEFFLLYGETFRNLDRPWMRQYYNTKEEPQNVDGCFPGAFKFYVPWVIDSRVDISFEHPDEESPFLIYPKKAIYAEIDPSTEYVEPEFVKFHFKSVGPHIDNDFGRIPRNSAMFDIVFKADDIIVERVKEFYNGN